MLSSHEVEFLGYRFYTIKQNLCEIFIIYSVLQILLTEHIRALEIDPFQNDQISAREINRNYLKFKFRPQQATIYSAALSIYILN